jgi:hypothetical protein
MTVADHAKNKMATFELDDDGILLVIRMRKGSESYAALAAALARDELAADADSESTGQDSL